MRTCRLHTPTWIENWTPTAYLTPCFQNFSIFKSLIMLTQLYMFDSCLSFHTYFSLSSSHPLSLSPFPQELQDSFLFLELTKPSFHVFFVAHFLFHSVSSQIPFPHACHPWPFFFYYSLAPCPPWFFFIVLISTYVVHIFILYLLYYTLSTWRQCFIILFTSTSLRLGRDSNT